MGGPGSGGARVGGGARPKTAAEAALTGSRGPVKRGVKPGKPGKPEPVPAPEGLNAAARAIWDRDAPLALKALTLTPTTSGAFADYCRAVSVRDALLARLEKDGWTVGSKKGGLMRVHPLAGEHRAWMQRVETAQGRFRLTALGKEIVPPTPDDAFAQFDSGGSMSVEPEE